MSTERKELEQELDEPWHSIKQFTVIKWQAEWSG